MCDRTINRGTRPSGSTTVGKGTVTTFPSALFISNTCNICRSRSCIFYAALNYDNEVPLVVPADGLTKEVIDVAITFVDIASRSEKNMDKRVYLNIRGNSVTLARLRPVLDSRWLSDDVSNNWMSSYRFKYFFYKL